MRRRGDLIEIDLDISRGAWLPGTGDVERDDADDLPTYATRVRAHADTLEAEAARLRQVADKYDHMAADGWELTTYTPGSAWVWPLRDTKPGPSFAPRPRR